MTAAATAEAGRRDPAVTAARARHVLHAAAHVHAQWPDEGRTAIGETFVALDTALEEYDAAGDGDREQTAETAACAMALLLIAVQAFLGEDVANGMKRNAAEAAR